MNFGFSILNSLILFLINRRLLGLTDVHIQWVHELIRAGANTLIALPIFLMLDYTKRPE
jgi:rod shape-determining protein MreD